MKALILMVLFVVSFASSAQVTGTFTCQHNEKVTVVAGGRSAKLNAYETTQVTLNPDGTMFATNPALPGEIFPGTWYVSRGKMYFNPDLNKGAEFAVKACSLSGANCIFLGQTYTYNMKVNKSETEFGGRNRIRLTMLVNGQLRTATTISQSRCRKN